MIDRGLLPELRCSMAMAGDRPSMKSTSELLHLVQELPGVGGKRFQHLRWPSA